MMKLRYDITNMEIPDMLDAFIIDRLRRQREERENERARRVPLRIEIPVPERDPSYDAPRRDERPPSPERGEVILDYDIETVVVPFQSLGRS